MRLGWSSMVRVALSATAMLGITALGIAYAQTAPVFEVSPPFPDIRKGPGRIQRISRTPQRLAFQAAGVADVIAFAYGLPLDHIERRPQWMYDDLYNVAVDTASPATLPEQKLMLEQLLEQKFSLAAHQISTPSPVYYLVAGPRVNVTKSQETDATDLPEVCSAPRLEFASGALMACEGGPASMNDLAAWLYQQLKLPVLDKTGITGLFDIGIHGIPMRGGAEGTIEAVRKSLGLNLELHQGTAQSLVIDRVERPKAN